MCWESLSYVEFSLTDITLFSCLLTISELIVSTSITPVPVGGSFPVFPLSSLSNLNATPSVAFLGLFPLRICWLPAY